MVQRDFVPPALADRIISLKTAETGRVTGIYAAASYKRIRPGKRTRPSNTKGRGSDRLPQPLAFVSGVLAQLLQARALAVQLQLSPSGLRQAVTLLRARDQRV